jgi:hypothetical protein
VRYDESGKVEVSTRTEAEEGEVEATQRTSEQVLGCAHR